MLTRSIVSFAILVGIGVFAVMTAAAVASAPPTIVLERPVHFLTPSGEDDVVVGPGTYEVEAAKEGLRLTPKEGKAEEAKLIQANPMPHPESLQVPKAVAEPRDEDALYVALLLPEGTGLEAVGSYSGVRPRGVESSNTAYGMGALEVFLRTTNAPASQNTAIGVMTLERNIVGMLNTAVGTLALQDSNGNFNTAVGGFALNVNKTGVNNTAIGFSALKSNLGNLNTAVGSQALKSTTGNYNTAVGAEALAASNLGQANTATGYKALTTNNSGAFNTASGNAALGANLGGSNNTASGAGALRNNSAGNENTALGADALYRNTTGVNSTALGVMALYNATGHNNIAVGNRAGVNQTTGSHNIYVNHEGVAGESNTIRLGTPGTQTQAFIAGIAGVAVGGTPVVVTAYGQLGIQGSSLRYKEDIRDLGTMSEGLHQLRPVSFRYKADTVAGVGDASREFGLIAEEVAEVYPELVGRDADGEIVTVKYHALIPMLLNELQQEHQHNQNQDRLMVEQRQQLEVLRAEVAALKTK